MLTCKTPHFSCAPFSDHHNPTVQPSRVWLLRSGCLFSVFPTSVSYSSPKCFSKSRSKNVLPWDDSEGGERSVHCEVEVISWRERRIKAQVFVNADIESVWNALTDYERLADFIPNLVYRNVRNLQPNHLTRV